MTISPVKPGGWGPNQTPQLAEFAQIDQRLAAYGLDTLAADTVSGVLSFTQDPNHPSVHPTIQTGGLACTAAGANIDAIAGDLILGDNDVPQYTSNRPRTVRVSCLEAARSSPQVTTTGNQLLVDAASGGIYADGYSDFILPITKPHDGSTLNSVTVYCFYNAQPSVEGTVSNALVARWNPAVGFSSLTTLGSSAPGTISYSPGVIWFAVTGLTNNVLDLQTYAYGIFVRHNSVPTGARLIFTGYSISYTAIADARFTQ